MYTAWFITKRFFYVEKEYGCWYNIKDKDGYQTLHEVEDEDE